MPDRRKHRGQHPEDARLFGESALPRLCRATAQLAWLLTRGYAIDSALKLVGDRHDLTRRQRMAIRRASCSDHALATRTARLVSPERVASSPLGIDGYNALITVEAALSGGIVLIGRDGCYRDLASVHGTYRHVNETHPAVEMLLEAVHALAPRRADLFLDGPVSNSGRLKATIVKVLEQGGDAPDAWNIEIVDNPDMILAGYEGTVATSDAGILDQGVLWIDLPRRIIDTHVPSAWKVDLRATA